METSALARRGRLAGALLAGALAACRGGTPEESLEGCGAAHARMLQELERIDRESREHSPYLAEAPVEALRQQVASSAGTEPAEERVRLLSRLGLEELRLGNIAAALEALLAAERVAKELPEARRAEAQAYLDYQLGVAYLRQAETLNCVARHAPESCIAPIVEAARHRDPEPSRRAMERLERVLRALSPQTKNWHAARWLYNLAAMTLGLYPQGVPEPWRIPQEVFRSAEPFPRFRNVAPALGLDVVNLSGGAIADDFDGDGFYDIVTSTIDTRGPMHFFRNNGDGTFTERSAEARLDRILGGLNLVHADYDNDGDLDILVLRGAWFGEHGRHANSLLRNDGQGRFCDVAYEAGIAEPAYPTQTAAWADYDLDGDLDLYVGNEAWGENRFPGQLYRNNGDGTFTDVAAEAGVENLRPAKGVVWGDFDEDRWPDLYVSNLGAPNRLYRNNGDGTFTDVAEAAGVTGPRDSFPVWFWDYDNDGHLDLYVSSYYQVLGPQRLYETVASYVGLPGEAERPALYRGDGRGGFRNVAAEVGLTLVTYPMGANFGDLDNDGFLDFYLGTGYPSYDGLMPNVMYHNLRGRRFVDVSAAGGFGHLQKGHGVAFADFDGDGDQDVFEQMGGGWPGDAFADVLYENPGFGNSWIEVKLVGRRSARCAIGARIRVEVVEDGVRREIHRVVGSGGSFGANPLAQHVGLGRAARAEVLEVFWPASGERQRFEDVPAGRRYEIVEGGELRELVRSFRERP